MYYRCQRLSSRRFAQGCRFAVAALKSCVINRQPVAIASGSAFCVTHQPTACNSSPSKARRTKLLILTRTPVPNDWRTGQPGARYSLATGGCILDESPNKEQR